MRFKYYTNDNICICICISFVFIFRWRKYVGKKLIEVKQCMWKVFRHKQTTETCYSKYKHDGDIVNTKNILFDIFYLQNIQNTQKKRCSMSLECLNSVHNLNWIWWMSNMFTFTSTSIWSLMVKKKKIKRAHKEFV